MAHNKVYGFCENKCKVEVPSLTKYNQDLQNIQNNVNQGLQGLSQGLLHFQQFTFIVNSNEALSNWASNKSGYDYTSVLIKKGTWTSSVGVNLTTTGTKVVVGEAGSKLIFTSDKGLHYNDVPTSPEYYMQTVTIELSYNGSAYGFYKCTNLTNCTSQSVGNGQGLGVGFNNCNNLTNCVGYGKGYGGGDGFKTCNNLTNCTGIGIGTAFSNGNGFNGCKLVSKCKAGGHCGANVFINCYASQSENETYACADTPEGGFNDVTNPAE
jgi:hypothetical protein